jgi:flagellar biosynthesis protein FlhG
MAIQELIKALSSTNSESGIKAREQLAWFYPRIVLNMGRTNNDIALGSKLREIVLKNLGMNIEYIGFLPYDTQVSPSILKREPINVLYPNSNFSGGIDNIAEKLIYSPEPKQIHLYESDEDLVELMEESSSTFPNS